MEHYPDSALVEDSPLSVRSYYRLLSSGYRTVGEVRAAKLQDLLKIKGLGRKSLNEIAWVFGIVEPGAEVSRGLLLGEDPRVLSIKQHLPTINRNARIYLDRENGMTFVKIAARYGISRARVAQIYFKVNAILNGAKRAGYEQVRQAYKDEVRSIGQQD